VVARPEACLDEAGPVSKDAGAQGATENSVIE
jgi:hypothetical protein